MRALWNRDIGPVIALAMNMVRPEVQTPRDRLQRITRYSSPYAREIGGPRYLIGVALVLGLLALVAIAIAAISGAADIFGAYAQWIKSLAAP